MYRHPLRLVADDDAPEASDYDTMATRHAEHASSGLPAHAVWCCSGTFADSLAHVLRTAPAALVRVWRRCWLHATTPS